jgi:ABC-2 type transport system permease protein
VRELRGAGLVALRELTEAFRRKSFWVIVVVMFLGSSAGMVVPSMVGGGGPTTYTVAVDAPSPSFERALREGLLPFKAKVEVKEIAGAAAVKAAVTDGRADAGVLFDDPPVVIADANDHPQLVAASQQALAVIAQEARLRSAGLSAAQVRSALAPAGAGVDHLHADRERRVAASFSVSIVLYILLLVLMMQVANGTAIEKSNRISEVLLAIVRPGALLFGKVLGVTITGVIVLLAAVLPVVVKQALGGNLPDGLGAAVLGGAVWFVLGLVIYLTLAGALGALVERQEEVGTAVTPLMALLIGTFVVVEVAPTSTAVAVLAYVPLCAPLVVPVRLASGASSPVEVVGSLAIGVVTAVVLARVAAVVYRRAIVRTGRRLHLRDVVTSRHPV